MDKRRYNGHPCVICGKTTNVGCGECRKTYYCSVKCMTIDWPSHSKTCRSLSSDISVPIPNHPNIMFRKARSEHPDVLQQRSQQQYKQQQHDNNDDLLIVFQILRAVSFLHEIGLTFIDGGPTTRDIVIFQEENDRFPHVLLDASRAIDVRYRAGQRQSYMSKFGMSKNATFQLVQDYMTGVSKKKYYFFGNNKYLTVQEMMDRFASAPISLSFGWSSVADVVYQRFPFPFDEPDTHKRKTDTFPVHDLDDDCDGNDGLIDSRIPVSSLQLRGIDNPWERTRRSRNDARSRQTVSTEHISAIYFKGACMILKKLAPTILPNVALRAFHQLFVHLTTQQAAEIITVGEPEKYTNTVDDNADDASFAFLHAHLISTWTRNSSEIAISEAALVVASTDWCFIARHPPSAVAKAVVSAFSAGYPPNGSVGGCRTTSGDDEVSDIVLDRCVELSRYGIPTGASVSGIRLENMKELFFPPVMNSES